MIMTLYLLGIFMGAIDTGIVTPARTIIQNDLNVDEATGIWMITIYTLAYAASIPVMGKLADRYGRKPIYLVAITLFGVGSLLCGLSQSFGGFGFLIAARAVQAIGGGGILPIATAEFGTEVPPEKRGLALGLVGGVFGVANIFGASAGSLILDIFGTHRWPYIFYVNLPISAVIIVAGLVFLPNHRVERVARIDLLGIALLVGMILALLYGLRNIDFFDLGASLTSPEVWPFLVAFAVLLPAFLWAERRAADPVTNLAFFRSRPIVVTLAVAFLTGFILMGTVFVPQFAENSLKVASGKGGYFVIILGVASGIGAPLSGRLTDQFGPKRVLGFGLLTSVVGAAVLIGWAIPQPSVTSVVTALALLGLGLGFSIGSPLNYMMLEHTEKRESNSALATLSLIRSVGTTIAPAIMVGLLAHSGAQLQTSLTDLLPKEVGAPALPYAAQLQAKFDRLKTDPNFKDRLKGVTIPDLTSKTTIQINPTGDGTLPDDLVELLRTADVTNITDRVKVVAVRMYDANTPGTIADIQSGVGQAIDGIEAAGPELESGITKLSQSLTRMDGGIAGQTKGINGMTSGINGQTTAISKMASGIAGQTRGINGMTGGINAQSRAITGMAAGIAGQSVGIAKLRAAIAAQTNAINKMGAGVAGMTRAKAGMSAGIAGLASALDAQRTALAALKRFDSTMRALLPAGVTATPVDFVDLLPPPVRAQLPQTALQQLRGVRSLAQLQAKISGLGAAISSLTAKRAALQRQLTALAPKLTALTSARAKLMGVRAKLASARQSLIAKRAQLIRARSKLIAARANLAAARARLVAARAALAGARTKLIAARAHLIAQRTKLISARASLLAARAKVSKARDDLRAAKADLAETLRRLGVLRDAVPGAFEQAKQTYLTEIEKRRPALETAFQSTLNGGFRDVYLTTAIACLLGLALLTAYPGRARPARRHTSVPG